MTIDAHVHLFEQLAGCVAEGLVRGDGYGKAFWGNRIVQFIPPFSHNTEFTAEMLIAFMDWCGISKAVLMQGPVYGDRNNYVAQVVKKYPGRFTGLAYFDPWNPVASEQFRMICSAEVFCGIKLECTESCGLFGLHGEASLGMPGLEWLWAGMEKQGMVLALDLGKPGNRSYETSAVRSIAKKHSGLKIVIAHLGQPFRGMGGEDYNKWQEQISLGLSQNIWFDMASLLNYFEEDDFHCALAAGFIKKAINIIGPQKMMWGTDIPTLFMRYTYAQMLKIAEHQLAYLSTHDRELVLGGNAQKVYFG